MDQPQRQRVRDDLKGLIKGDLLFDDLSRTLYSTDASIFQVEPIGVVLPRDESDVQAVVRWAAEHQVALVPRGAGTGLAGEALGTGLIIDLSRYFREILEIGPDWVRVQPGVVYRSFESGAGRDRPAAHASIPPARVVPRRNAGDECDVPMRLRHGCAIMSALRVVLDSGDAVRVGRESRWPPAEKRAGRLEDIISSVATLLEQNADLIRAGRRRARFDRCGYQLDELLHPEQLDLHRLLVGTEGTLGIFTEATLRTIPLPVGQCLVLLGLGNVEDALRTAQIALPAGPAACELLDQRLLSLARGLPTGLDVNLPPRSRGGFARREYESDNAEDAGYRRPARQWCRWSSAPTG